MTRIPLTLTPGQRRPLRRSLKDPPDANFAGRALALLELDRGQTVAQVADLLGVSRQSVYNWVAAYTQSPSPQTLADHYGIGRPSLWTEELQALLLTCLQQRPTDLGYAGVNWTVPLLQEQLYHLSGQWLSDDTVRRQLDRLGYVWKRFRYVLAPDPEREKKTAHPQAAQGIAASKRQAV